MICPVEMRRVVRCHADPASSWAMISTPGATCEPTCVGISHRGAYPWEIDQL
jgi:hypothetical protein